MHPPSGSFSSRLIACIILVLGHAALQAAPAVSNLSASQRAGTKLVDLSYDLAAPGLSGVAVSLEVSSDAGTTWTVTVAAVSGAIGANVTPGSGRTIVWNAGADWPNGYSAQMLFRVTADGGVSPIAGFSYIPRGSFTMGRISSDIDTNAPPVTVTVSGFCIQQTETTKGLWDDVRTWGLSNGYTDLTNGAGKGANHPVTTLNWYDVVKWCNARSEKEGLTPCYTTLDEAIIRIGENLPYCNWNASGYRLPTEAEWEKSARGGATGKRFPWGTDTINHSNTNYYANSASFNYDTSGYTSNTFHPTYGTGAAPYTSPVGSFSANDFGVYDMSGNVWEWCWDFHNAAYYANGAIDPKGPPTSNSRIIRGGSFNHTSDGQRCSHRNFSGPMLRHGNTGFRTVYQQQVQLTASSSLDTRTPAEIEVESPVGTALIDGVSTAAFDAMPTSSVTQPRSFSIRNTGELALQNLSLIKSGQNVGDFNLGSLSTLTLAPGESTAFTVTFAPGAGASGARTTTLQVASNDADENPFDIALSGMAYSTTLDADSDGMNDWGEVKLSALGFDWQTPNNALVSALYNNAGAAGLFTSTQVQDLNVGIPLMQRNHLTGEFTLTIGVDKSTNLSSWTPMPMTGPQVLINGQGKLEFRFNSPDNAAFFRLKSQPTP